MHPEPVLARALTIVAGAHRAQDAHPESMKAVLEAIEIWQRLGDQAGEAIARCTAARVLVAVGQGDEAIAEADLALVTADRAGDRAARIKARTTLGAVCVHIAQFELCIEHCLRGLDLARNFSDDIVVGALLDTMACGHIGVAEHARPAGTATGGTRRWPSPTWPRRSRWPDGRRRRSSCSSRSTSTRYATRAPW
jgi:hypothetical protein